MSLLPLLDKTYWHFDLKTAKSAGKGFHEAYRNADPFPSIVLDNVFDEDVLNMCLALFPQSMTEDSQQHERPQENLKASFNPEHLSCPARSFFYALNSRPFLAFLENMTGVKGLIPDPYFLGGGFHRTQNGGHLGVHADFNYHPIMAVERRINALIYLNKDWFPEYGGQLELWDRQMSRCIKTIDPIFNRMVVFNTDSNSYHGQPDPIRHPGEESRKSIALYYYTATWTDAKRQHTTQFRMRPQSRDQKDYRVLVRETIQDLTPPILFRQLTKLAARRP